VSARKQKVVTIGGRLAKARRMRGRVSIPAPTFPSRDLVGHHEVLLHPVDGRGLVAAPALIVRERVALVAL
jgi:hypothetical protein